MMDAWKKFWFTPESPFNLGVVRFFVCAGGAVFHYFLFDRYPEGFYARWVPLSFYQLLPGPLGILSVEIIRAVWLLTLLLAGFGIAFRYTIWISFLAGVFYLGYNYNFGRVYHSCHLYIMVHGILACSPGAGDGFLFFKSQRRPRSPSDRYRWPLQLIKLYIVYVFFICGMQKVYLNHVTEWVTSNGFYNLLVSVPDQSAVNLWIQSKPVWVSKIFAAGALVVAELGAPLALLGGAYSVAYFFILSLFHVMVKATFGIHTMFFSQILTYTAFLNWERMAKTFGGASRG